MYRPRSSPYGDVYTIPTTPIDNIANRLYREQQIREQQKLQQDKALDDEFAKNVAGVKSADIPEITSAYNDFKQAHINLQKKGQKATPQDQMDVMLKKAAAFQAINASKEEKERIKNAIIEGRGDKKGRFIPTYQEVLTRRLNTPTSKVRDEDFDIRNVYSFPDMAKVTSGWMGKSKKVNVPTGAKSIKGDLYDDEYVFEKFNHPNQIYENAYREIAGRGDREAFENVVLESLTDEEKEKVKNDYFSITSSPEFKRIYGDVQPFPESAGKTRLGEAIALTTMGMVNKLPLKELDIESKPNTGAVIDKRFKQQKIMEGIKQANRKELFGMREAAKAEGEAANDLWVDSYIERLTEDAAASPMKGYDSNKNGQRIKEDRIQLDPLLSKLLSKDGVSPDQFAVQPNGQYRPIFYKRDKDGNVLKEKGNPVVDEIASVPMSKEQFKLLLGGKAGVKQLNKEMATPKKVNNKPTPKGW